MRVAWHKWSKQGSVEIFRNYPHFDKKEGIRTSERRIGKEGGRGRRERERERMHKLKLQ